MTAALLKPRPAETGGCRFPDWCNGSCEEGDVPGGERNHWSNGTRFPAFDVDERIAVELYDYENAEDGIDPVLVYLAAGDDDLDEDGVSIPTEQARSLGVLLREFSPKSKWPEDERIYTALDKDGDWAVTADYRHKRDLRMGGVQAEHVEFSIRPDSTRRHSIRVRLSMLTAKRLGRHLIAEADRAAASNAKFGLVS